MPRVGAPPLSHLREQRVRLICTRCPRAGEYDVARAIERYGDIAQPDLLARVSADCPNRQKGYFGPGCGVRFAPE